MTAVRKLVPLQVLNPTLASNGTSRIDMAELKPIGRLRNGTTYCAGIVLREDVTYNNSSGGGLTVPDMHSLDVFHTLRVHMPKRGYAYNLTQGRAGGALYRLQHMLWGRRPRVHGFGAGITVGAGGTLSVTSDLLVPFRFPSMKREDWEIPIDLLRDAQVEVSYPVIGAGGVFGADISLTAGTLTAYALLVERREFRVPPLWTVSDQELSGLDVLLPLAGRVVHAMAEIPVTADGLTENTITIGAGNERSELNLLFDGVYETERMTPLNAILDWNHRVARTRDEQLADTGAPFIPIVAPDPDWQWTYQPLGRDRPNLRLAGSDDSPRVVYLHSELQTEKSLVDDVVLSRVPVPDGFMADPFRFLSPKLAESSGFMPRGGPDVSTRLPWRLHAEPLRPTR